METTRRDILKMGGLGVLGVAGASALPWGATLGAKPPSALPAGMMPQPFRARFRRPPVLRPFKTERNRDGEPVDYFQVIERVGRAEIVPGLMTTVFGYNGIAPGPTINIKKGRRAVLRVRNHLPALNPLAGTEFTTAVHLHGSASLPQFDGYASDVTPPGFYKDYEYPDFQPARTLWYHDHGVHHTAVNAYAGLAAQYHIHDAAERDLLPQGEFDVPLTITDAQFARDGQLTYEDNSTSGMWGDVILVNGVPWPVMRVKRRVYRFRFLVAAVARSFRFTLDTGDPVTMVATDGGLMPRSHEVGAWRQSSGERYEALIDFRKYRAGQRVVLRNLSNKNNRDYDNTGMVMAFDVTDAPVAKRDATWRRIPETLVNSDCMLLKESQAVNTYVDRLHRTGGQWAVNGVTWEDVVDSDFQLLNSTPALHEVAIVEIHNTSGGWFHPAHMHLVDARMLTRNGRPVFDYERGPKDTYYMGEGEVVRVLAEFGPHRGRYMLHCHNLSHEDNDMMIQYAVGWRPGQPDPNDPILAAPPKVDNLPLRP